MAKTVFKTTGRKGGSDYTVEHGPGEYIFREGDLGTEMFIIHEGQVEILNRVGDEERLLAVLEKGDFFGEMALLEDRPRAASARALAQTRLLQINGSTFDQMLRDNPEIAVRMMRKLSRRLRETDDLLKVALGSSVHRPAPEMPTPDLTEIHASGPERLIHAPSGMEFALSRGSETTIGRKDAVTGIYPDVDLTPVDAQRSISRRHAKIYRRGPKFFLSEEIGTMNATFLNGARLETGVPAELKPNDEVRCGVVALKFEVP
ncbi:MAG TPA: cyclic nucleotide-binding domain-containing protein [Thermoanaerobaculia bacterium]|jgi:CRP-like cAMP-binding protein